jgi:ribonuclease HI
MFVHYAWGLGKVTNNFTKAYALWQCIRLTKAKGIQKIIILGDSMLMIRAIINQANIGSKVLPGVISCVISLLDGFGDYKVLHILHEHNSKADQWEKYGLTLEEGEIVVNGGRNYFHIP